MKIETKTGTPPKEFQPVTVSITFETQDELGVLTQFFGGHNCQSEAEAMHRGSKRYGCSKGDAEELIHKVIAGLYSTVNNAYYKAAV